MRKISSKQYVGLLSLVLILILLAGFFYYVDLPTLAGILLRARPGWFAAALAISLLWSLFPALRLSIMLRKQDIRIPFRQLFLVNLGTRFYSFFSPVSSVGSVMRFQRLIPPGKAAEGIAAFGAVRAFEISIALLMGLFWGFGALGGGALDSGIALLGLVTIAALLWTVLKVSAGAARWAENRQADAPVRLRQVYNRIGRLGRAFSQYQTLSVPELSGLFGIALAGDLIGLAGYLCVALSLNIPISFIDLGWMRSLMVLAAFTPFTLPGGLGMREVSSVLLMTGVGIGAEPASAFSLLIYMRSALSALLGGALEVAFNLEAIRATERIQ